MVISVAFTLIFLFFAITECYSARKMVLASLKDLSKPVPSKLSLTCAKVSDICYFSKCVWVLMYREYARRGLEVPRYGIPSKLSTCTRQLWFFLTCYFFLLLHFLLLSLFDTISISLFLNIISIIFSSCPN